MSSRKSQTRDHLTQRITWSRIQLEVARSRKGVSITLVGLLIAAASAGYIVSNISKTLFSDTATLAFAVDDATGVVAGQAPVRVKGIAAGTITKVDRRGGRPVLTVKVQKKFGTIYRNATASLRPNTPLQDMYLDITERGTASAGKLTAKDPLPESRTDTAVNISQVLNTFSADTRTRLMTLLDNLGNGLDDHGVELRNSFVELVPFIEAAGKITKTAARRGPRVKRIVHNMSELTAALAERDKMLRQLVADGSVTTKALQASSGDLDGTLAALPPTLNAVDSSFAALRGVLPEVNTAVRALDPVADALPDALADLRRLSDTAAPAVKALQTPVGKLAPTLRQVRPVAADAALAVNRFKPQVPTLNDITDTLVKCRRGVQGFFIWNTSMTKYGDRRGPFPRGNVVLEPAAVGVRTADEFPLESCAPGGPIPGRPPMESDKG